MSEAHDAPAEEVVDRRDALSEAFAAAETTQEAPAAETEAEARARDEKGRFAPKEAATEPVAEEVAAEPAEEPLWKRPPNSWKKDYHEPWATVPDPVKEYIYQRDAEQAAGVEPLKMKAQSYDQFEKAIEPYMPIMQGLGVQPLQAVAGLMENDRILRFGNPQQKQAKALELLSAYGINLAHLDPNMQPPIIDMQAAQQQMELNRQRAQLEQERQSWQQTEEQQMMAQINAVAPSLEHFEALRPQIIAILGANLVPEGTVADMTKAAYEKALRLDDDLFASTQQSQQAAREAERKAAADLAAKNARAAAVSVRSASPGAPTATKAQDRRALLEEQFSGLGARL
jgi:hypothetical protein